MQHYSSETNVEGSLNKYYVTFSSPEGHTQVIGDSFNLPETREVEHIRVDKLFDYKIVDEANLLKAIQHNCCSLQQPRTSLSVVDILFSLTELLYHKFGNMMK
jgi:hypothetical protein